MDIGPPTEVHLHSTLYSEEHRTLPFPGVSANWYERQNELAVKNIARERHQQDSIVHLDEDNFLCVNKSATTGTLQSSLNCKERVTYK